MRITLIVAVLMAVAVPSHAQITTGHGECVPTPPLTFRTETIVTAERDPESASDVPAATTVFVKDEIEQLPAQRLSEVLADVPGFHVLFGSGLAGAATVSARGFFGGGEADYVRLLVDGVPVTELESGTADWSSLRAENIARIEVLRGPGSTFYGDSATAGVVQVFTRSAMGRRGSLAVGGGNFATRTIDGGSSLRLRRLMFVGFGSFVDTKGARAHSEEQELSAGMSASLATRLGGWTVRAARDSRDQEDPGPRSDNELTVDRFGSHPFFRYDATDRERSRASVAHQITTRRFDASTTAYLSLRDGQRIRTLLLAPGLPDTKLREFASHEIGVATDLRRAWDALALESRVGIEISDESLDSSYASVTPAGARGAMLTARAADRQRVAVFASEVWKPITSLRFLAGLRWDRVADTVDEVEAGVHYAWSPRAGVTYHIGNEAPVAIFSNVSRAFKTGTLDQLFDSRPYPDFRGGTFTIANPNLRPQTAWSIEAGASRTAPRYSWSAVAYRIAARNEIDFDPATFSYGNIGNSRHRGVELNGKLFHGSRLSPSLAYTWTRVEPQSGPTMGRQLKNIPPTQWRAALSARLPGSVSAHFAYARAQGAFLDDEGAFPLDGRNALDMRVSWRVRGLRAYVDVLNAADDRFEEYGYTLTDFSGRRVPYYLPGARRSARAGVTVEF